MEKFSRGSGLVEYVLVIVALAIVLIKVVGHFSGQLQKTTAQLASEISGKPYCDSLEENPTLIVDQHGLEYYYDRRVDRYRNRRTGRFIKQNNIVIVACR